MLRCTIEIVPYGEEPLKRLIEVVEIANISSASEIADYACIRKAYDYYGRLEPKAIAYVRGHNRADGAAELVRRAIEALGWMARYGKRSRKRLK